MSCLYQRESKASTRHMTKLSGLFARRLSLALHCPMELCGRHKQDTARQAVLESRRAFFLQVSTARCSRRLRLSANAARPGAMLVWTLAVRSSVPFRLWRPKQHRANCCVVDGFWGGRDATTSRDKATVQHSLPRHDGFWRVAKLPAYDHSSESPCRTTVPVYGPSHCGQDIWTTFTNSMTAAEYSRS